VTARFSWFLERSGLRCLRLADCYGKKLEKRGNGRKRPWRMNTLRKRRHRKRLRTVDAVVACLKEGMQRTGQTCAALERLLGTWKNESEMVSKDKYWVFQKNDPKNKYRKPVHWVAKFTKFFFSLQVLMLGKR
jgi:Mitochondrial ribosomal protein L31